MKFLDVLSKELQVGSSSLSALESAIENHGELYSEFVTGVMDIPDKGLDTLDPVVKLGIIIRDHMDRGHTFLGSLINACENHQNLVEKYGNALLVD